MRKINQQELQEVGLTPVEYIVAQWKDIFKDEKDKAFVCVINHERTEGKGYLLGVATRNKKGYQPTTTVLEEHNYNIANEWVNQVNKAIFNRDDKETMMLIISTMR